MIGIGTTLNRRFLLKQELGRGGMGAVYSANDQILQRSVAIKLLKEQNGEEVGKRLRLEAQIAARLLHDNVVRIYDFGEAEGIWYLVMEEVTGSSYVKRWRVLTLAGRLRILAQVAEALDYAHHQGVIHRDIKPGNVLLTPADVPKLSDFGLSLLVEHADQAGTIRGTPNYMSPEQARGKKLDFRTDLYSLGVMLVRVGHWHSAIYGYCHGGNGDARFPDARLATQPQRPDLRFPGESDPRPFSPSSQKPGQSAGPLSRNPFVKRSTRSTLKPLPRLRTRPSSKLRLTQCPPGLTWLSWQNSSGRIVLPLLSPPKGPLGRRRLPIMPGPCPRQ